MLEKIFTSHGFHLSPDESVLFERFLTLFIEYNTHTNLSAIRDEDGIIEKHFIDSLYAIEPLISLFPTIEQDSSHLRLLDIGSGGGFPGIPLKIILPNLDITLLDSVGKKVKAMNHFITELGLENIRAIQDRAENLAKDTHHANGYDIIVSRATAYISDILTWAVPFLAPGGKIILYKMPSDEEASDRKTIMKKLSLTLEGELEYVLAEKSRVLLIFQKN